MKPPPSLAGFAKAHDQLGRKRPVWPIGRGKSALTYRKVWGDFPHEVRSLVTEIDRNERYARGISIDHITTEDGQTFMQRHTFLRYADPEVSDVISDVKPVGEDTPGLNQCLVIINSVEILASIQWGNDEKVRSDLGRTAIAS